MDEKIVWIISVKKYRDVFISHLHQESTRRLRSFKIFFNKKAAKKLETFLFNFSTEFGFLMCFLCFLLSTCVCSCVFHSSMKVESGLYGMQTCTVMWNFYWFFLCVCVLIYSK